MVFDSMSKGIFQSFTGKIIDLANPSPSMIDIEDIAQALSMTCRFGGHCRDFYSVSEHCVHAVELALGGFSGTYVNPSVAQVTLEYRRPPSAEILLSLLLHDASEAYVGDVISPLKHLLTGFNDIRGLFEKGIGEALRWDGSAPLDHSALLGVVIGQKAIELLEQLLPGFEKIERSWHLAIGEAFGLGSQLADSSSFIQQMDMAVLGYEAIALFPTLADFWADIVPRPHPGRIQIECWSPRDARLRFMDVFRELQAARGIHATWPKPSLGVEGGTP